MSWGEVFFGFHGRINRRTFWIGWILTRIVGAALVALLSYLITGDPVSPDVWLAPAGKGSLWMPVWSAWLMLVAWPGTALAIKRLHDRERPSWLWYAFFCGTIVTTLSPLKNVNGVFLPLAPLLLIFQAYVVIELAVLKGTRGPNSHGADSLPSGYCGGDHDFLSLMLGWEGRIRRAKWWFGLSLATGAGASAFIAMIAAAEAFLSRHPGLEQSMANPGWIGSAEAEPAIFGLWLWTGIPMAILAVAGWSFLALSVKRLHDRGLSSWLILIVPLPVLGALFLAVAHEPGGLTEAGLQLPLALLLASLIWGVLQFGILRGEAGPNKHGPDPLAERSHGNSET
jgi:uncharacterized membrane protein YhaH (DUF805 family)